MSYPKIYWGIKSLMRWAELIQIEVGKQTKGQRRTKSKPEMAHVRALFTSFAHVQLKATRAQMM